MKNGIHRFYEIYLLTLFLVTTFCMPNATATENRHDLKQRSFSEDFLENFSWKTLKDDFSSPVLTDAKYALLLGSSVTATVLVFRHSLDYPVNESFRRNRPLGYSSAGDILGTGAPNFVYYLGMSGMYYFKRERKYSHAANLMLRATMHSGFVSTVLKSTVREGRPYDENVKTSFPSGHATMAFAFASAVAAEHEWYWGLSAYALATYVGLSRVNDYQHFFRDVLAGATIGISYGVGVAQDMHGSRGSVFGTREISSARISITPHRNLSGAELTSAWDF